MKKQGKTIDPVSVIISLLLAICFWNYTMNSQNPTRTLEYRDISVQLVGADDLYNAYSLSVVEGADTTVNVKVSASSNRLANLTASQIKVRADLTESISSPGQYDISYEVVLPETGMTCVSSSPATIRVTVDRIETKSVPVEVKIDGKPSDEYKIGTPVLQVSTVNITGPEQELDKVANAVVMLDAEELTDSVADVSYDYKLVDSEGNGISSKNISRETTRVKLSLDVLKVKTVPLKVSLTPKEDADVLNASAVLSVDKVKIQGDPEAVDAVDSITVGTINVSKAENGDMFTFEIPLPTGVEMTDGQEKIVHAELKLDDVKKKSIQVTDILLTDTAAAKGNAKQPKLLTDAVTIRIEGREKVLDQLEAGDIYIVAEIDSSELSIGKHKVGVQVEVPNTISVIGSYSVEVQISEKS